MCGSRNETFDGCGLSAMEICAGMEGLNATACVGLGLSVADCCLHTTPTLSKHSCTEILVCFHYRLFLCTSMSCCWAVFSSSLKWPLEQREGLWNASLQPSWDADSSDSTLTNCCKRKGSLYSHLFLKRHCLPSCSRWYGKLGKRPHAHTGLTIARNIYLPVMKKGENLFYRCDHDIRSRHRSSILCHLHLIEQNLHTLSGISTSTIIKGYHLPGRDVCTRSFRKSASGILGMTS